MGDDVRSDAWELDADQMIFMMQRHDAIENAYQRDDMAFLRALAESPDYQAVFG